MIQSEDDLLFGEDIEGRQPSRLTRLWWWFWGAPYYSRHGYRYWLESCYMWLGKRLPAGLVFCAVDQLREFAEERNMPTIEILEAQSNWLIEKMR